MKSQRSFGRLRKPKLFVVRRVSGDSMLPALRQGRVVVGRVNYGLLLPGDVVIIHHGGLEKVKRIQQLKDDRMFLVGDNEAQSTDSRAFGWLHVSAVTAKVVWPATKKRVP